VSKVINFKVHNVEFLQRVINNSLLFADGLYAMNVVKISAFLTAVSRT